MYKLKLRELRENKNVTQSEIAEYLKITRSAYSQYESGKRQMNYDTLCLLSDYFAVSIDYLLGKYETNPMLVNKKESHIIELYRLLDERGKSAVESMLNFEYEQSKGGKEPKAFA
ncbi:MAG: helix-turn-helix domain-containing protein [Oscillospiraceae bacterium]|nr:helix-turn-helix domain-containing protein [Oscillospiraceae bacterium]